MEGKETRKEREEGEKEGGSKWYLFIYSFLIEL